jgi:hypothetical protein
MVGRPLSEAAAEVDPLLSLLPYSQVPHITGNFLSWGPPIPMLPVRFHRQDAMKEPILSPTYNTMTSSAAGGTSGVAASKFSFSERDTAASSTAGPAPVKLKIEDKGKCCIDASG